MADIVHERGVLAPNLEKTVNSGKAFMVLSERKNAFDGTALAGFENQAGQTVFLAATPAWPSTEQSHNESCAYSYLSYSCPLTTATSLPYC